jgi:hypothetical protein
MAACVSGSSYAKTATAHSRPPKAIAAAWPLARGRRGTEAGRPCVKLSQGHDTDTGAPEHRRRLCDQCDADRARLGAMVLKDSNPEMIGPKGMEREFCSWERLADWSAVQAGRRVPPPLESSGGMSRRFRRG